MGELFIHDLQPYIDKYGCNVFVETGTGIGTGLEHALKYGFRGYGSVEINRQLFNDAQKKYGDQVRLVHDHSVTGLKHLIGLLYGNPISILFWLDAHFPGADFQLGSYDDPHPDEIKYPLLEELKTIFRLRPDNKDVFIIDDLQLYEDGDYELELAPDFLAKHRRPIQPILDIVSKTHNIKRDYRHQGFLILEPK